MYILITPPILSVNFCILIALRLVYDIAAGIISLGFNIYSIIITLFFSLIVLFNTFVIFSSIFIKVRNTTCKSGDVQLIEKRANWKEEYSLDNCYLKNKEYVKFLTHYLTTQDSSMVLNIKGSWGTGKTHLIRQLYTHLRFNKDKPCIYIDAWISDFSNDPILVLISELLDQLKQINSNFYSHDKEKEIFKALGNYSMLAWNASVSGLGVYLSGKFDNTSIYEGLNNFKFKNLMPKVVGRKLNESYKSQRDAIEETKNAFKNLLEHEKVFVFVDELDRCKPTYAIAMLETIKHFFDLDNFIFVIATDTSQLYNSVKSVYGSSFDSQEYLSKFFTRSAELPKPCVKTYLKHITTDKDKELLKEHGYLIFSMVSIENEIINNAGEIAKHYGLSLRRVEQIWSKFMSILSFHAFEENEKIGKLSLDASLLFQLLIEYEVPKYNFLYDARRERKFNVKDLFDEMSDQNKHQSQNKNEQSSSEDCLHSLTEVAKLNRLRHTPSPSSLPSDLTALWELISVLDDNQDLCSINALIGLSGKDSQYYKDIFAATDKQTIDKLSNAFSRPDISLPSYIGFYYNAIEIFALID
ncbi:P-loop NTPase fold protein [Vibrio neptunius]|uniref:KAP family P-loop NTPase fold protein n=1 Tax=Vibrio neptunius TaxID=170651 RepID=UPI0033164455